jgi:tetratricopeptide (TPR) repeat protein
MATTFVLASCLALLRDLPEPTSRRNYWWALVFFVLALYSKESAVPFALLCLPLLAWRRCRNWWPAFRLSLPFLLAAFVFVAHRHLVIGRTSQTTPISGGYVQTLIDTLSAGQIYARLLAGIPPFCIDYTYMDSNQALGTPSVMIGYALLAGLILGTLLAWRSGLKLLGAGLLWFLIFMLPCSNLIPLMQYCAERFLYLPLLGWIVALASLAVLIPNRRLAITICSLVVVTWSGVAWQRSWIWRDPLTLFLQSHLDGPTTPRVQNNAISAAFAQPHMRAAFSRGAKPGQPSEVILSPTITNQPPEWAGVEATLAQLHKLFPEDTAVALALGHCHSLQGRTDEAVPCFERAVELYPGKFSFWISLVRAYVAAGRDAEAEAACQRALALNANHLPTLEHLAAVQHRRKKFSAALQTYAKLRAAAPENRDFAERAAELERQLASLPTPPP